MKPLVCIYIEGNDTKLAVVGKEKESDKLKVLRTGSVSSATSSVDIEASSTGINLDEGALQLEGLDGDSTTLESDVGGSSVAEIQKEL